MDRPKIDKPRLDMWKNDDQALGILLKHIEDKSFNVNSWTFTIKALNKDLTYDDLLKHLREPYPSMVYLDAMREWYMYLPEMMRRMKEELFSVFKRYTLNIQERANFIQNQDEYITHLETKVGEAEEALFDARKELADLKLLKENEKLSTENKLMRAVIAQFSNDATPAKPGADEGRPDSDQEDATASGPTAPSDPPGPRGPPRRRYS